MDVPSSPRLPSWPPDGSRPLPAAVPTLRHDDGSLRGRWRRRPPWLVPTVLFLGTCFSTIYAGRLRYGLAGALTYAISVMVILTCHEMGHWLQARRYRVPASLPYFIPMPFSPLGTMGAIIAMRSRISSSKALFDIGISGPLAGLVPTLLMTVIGLRLSTVVDTPPQDLQFFFGTPLLFRLLIEHMFGALEPGQVLLFHPLVRAGWVGMLITALNLLPIGQLDGGHILYALLRERAQKVSLALLIAAVLAVVVGGYYMWLLMLIILIMMGYRHPPTNDPEVPLGWGRVVLGWLTLAFLVLGFTPQPIVFAPPGTFSP